MGGTHTREMLLVIVPVLVDVSSVFPVFVVYGIGNLVLSPLHKILAECITPAVPQNDIFETGSSAPVSDSIAKHDPEGSEGDLLIRVYMVLSYERSSAIDQGDIRMVRLCWDLPKEVG